MALKSNGTLWAWGSNYFAALGDGTTVDKHVPTQIGTDNDWAVVVCGDQQTFALKSHGALLKLAPTSIPASAAPVTQNHIAFASDRDGNYEIYVMNADGSVQTNLTNNSAFDSGLAWSPDGANVAFHSQRDGNWEIYVMYADGSAQTNLTNDPFHDEYPAW
jgi:hypothetical protein